MIKVQLILRAPFRPHRLAWPRTLAFQASNTGSNPVGDTNTYVISENLRCPYGAHRSPAIFGEGRDFGMRQWEYRFRNIYDQPVEVTQERIPSRDTWLEDQLKVLNDMGSAGWEFVVFMSSPNDKTIYPPGTALFKREGQSKG